MDKMNMSPLKLLGLLTPLILPLSQNIAITMEPEHNRGMHGLHKCGRIGDLLEFNSTEVLGVHVLFSSIDEFVICSETYGTLL